MFVCKNTLGLGFHRWSSNPVVAFWRHLLWWLWGCFGFIAHNTQMISSFKDGSCYAQQRQVFVPFPFLIFLSAAWTSMTFPLKLYPISRISLNPELLFSACSESEVCPLSLHKDLFICGAFTPDFSNEWKRKHLPWKLSAQHSCPRAVSSLSAQCLHGWQWDSWTCM